MVRDAAGHDAVEMRQIGFDIDRDAVKADPFAHLYAVGRDLVLARGAVGQGRFLGPLDPDADAAFANLALDVELVQRRDHPVFKALDELPHVAPAGGDMKHDIGHALAGAVIGVLPAAARLINWKAVRLGQVSRIGAGAGLPRPGL